MFVCCICVMAYTHTNKYPSLVAIFIVITVSRSSDCCSLRLLCLLVPGRPRLASRRLGRYPLLFLL